MNKPVDPPQRKDLWNKTKQKSIYQEENSHADISKVNVQTTMYEQTLLSKDSEYHIAIEKRKI
jgi:hypothetical protein